MGKSVGTDVWTSRQRLLTAFECGVPDRVPINTYEMAGRDSRDWYNRQASYASLMDFIRAQTDCITNWNPEPVGDDFLGSERFLGSDQPLDMETSTESVDGYLRTTRVLHTPRGDLRSVTQADPGVHTTWVVEHWCKSVDDVDRALSIPYVPATYDASDLARVREELGDNGIIMASLADPAYLAADLMAFQDFLLWVVEETEHYTRTVEILSERVMENLRRQLDCCVVDSYRICGPEYMTPPYLSPSMFRRFMLPHVRRMTEIIHGHDALVRLHCHGKIALVLDMILETGCDGLDPCEPPPDGDLELSEVKRRCLAQGVSVWGNIELKVLETASTAEVREEVRRILEAAKDGGGFVLLPTAAPINLPLSPKSEENYRAFIEAGLEFGEY